MERKRRSYACLSLDKTNDPRIQFDSISRDTTTKKTNNVIAIEERINRVWRLSTRHAIVPHSSEQPTRNLDMTDCQAEMTGNGVDLGRISKVAQSP